jgi:hypothetical protein
VDIDNNHDLHIFPFNFTLPICLPPTMWSYNKNGNSIIHYFLRCKLVTFDMGTLQQTYPITIYHFTEPSPTESVVRIIKPISLRASLRCNDDHLYLNIQVKNINDTSSIEAIYFQLICYWEVGYEGFHERDTVLRAWKIPISRKFKKEY